MANQRRGRGWLWNYTLIMAALQGVWLLCMLLGRRTLLCHSDAYYQQYTTLRYTAEAVRRLLSGGGFDMVDFRLGQGLDAMASLNFYGLTNPLYWLGALFTGRGLEIYYQLLVFLYRWLEGFCFGLYLRRTRLAGDEDWPVLAGSLMFAFCGYNTAGILKCPYFAAGGICLCLMLLAVERCFDEGKWISLSLATLLTLLVNFYHGYQTLLMAALYVLARLACRLPARGLRRTLREGAALLAAAVCGLLLSGFMLLPTLLAFMDSARSGAAAGYRGSLWLYPGAYYRQLFADFFAPYAQAEYWTQLNFVPWTAAGLCALALTKGDRRLRWLRAGVLLAVLGACVPLVGKAFNGMSYVTNRWSYALAFLCCAGAAAGLPRLAEANFGGRRAAGALLALWAALTGVIALLGVEDAYLTQTVLGVSLGTVAILAGAALLLCVAAWLILRRGGKRAPRFICVTLALCCLAYSGGFGALMLAGEEFYPVNLDQQIARQTDARTPEAEGFSRLDVGISNGAHAPLLDYSGTGYYWSIIPGHVSQYYMDLQVPTLRWVFQLRGLGGDPYLSAAAAVGGATRPEAAPAVLPWGFEPAGEAGVYRNAHALPLGVFFTETLSEASYRALSPLQKREALLRAAVLPEGADTYAPEEIGEAVPVSFGEGQGATLDAQGLRGAAGGTATLRYDAPEGSLIWLWIREPWLNRVDNDSYLQVDVRREDDARGLFYVSKPQGNYYFPQEGLLVYLGKAKAGEETLALRLQADAELSFADLQVVTVPAQRYAEAADALAGTAQWTGRVGQNAVTGSCVAPQAGVLQLSIPYSTGWRATVDGQPAPLTRCGGMYLGLSLDAGEHQIALRYVTPGLKPGAALTGVGLLLLAIGAALGRRKRAGRG